ncbi:MAG: SMC-Scp complex subunit ScpB [Ignavibacteriae bacterium]|nr:SMC-Scp complex subunit ScpB [Ignavibacteriota bacterium]MCB9217582.1 SMC-Scp complex subunit ScpB [Ignavibacteria bacterium]
MIFASEDPVAPRTLLRLLYEDESKGKKGGELPTERTLFDLESGEGVESLGEGGEEEAEAESADVRGEESEEEPEKSAEQIGQKELRTMIAELNDEYEAEGRPFRIMELAGGFQFATTKEYGEFVGLLSKERSRRRLSPAALETLAIVAYRQPVTKPEVEAIRGVNCDQVLLSLLERNLITITGRSEAVGKPLLYGTTEDFLRAFGLNSLSDLPKLRELEELMEDDAYSATRPEGVSEEVTQELLELDGGEDHPAAEALVSVEGEPVATAEEGEQTEISPPNKVEEIVEETEVVGDVEEKEVEGLLPDEMILQEDVEIQEMSIVEVIEQESDNLNHGNVEGEQI